MTHIGIAKECSHFLLQDQIAEFQKEALQLFQTLIEKNDAQIMEDIIREVFLTPNELSNPVFGKNSDVLMEYINTKKEVH